MQALFEGIYSHFNTVNDLNTALSGNLYPHEAPQGTVFPYGTYNKVSGFHDWTFAEFHEEIQVQFSLYSNETSPANVNTLYGYLIALFDDAEISITGYERVYFLRSEDVPLRDAERRTWAYHVTYRVLLEKSRGR